MTELSFSYEQMGELYLNLPYSDIKGWEFEGRSLIIDLDRTPLMTRLIGIKQLGILTPATSQIESARMYVGFIHDRRSHSLMVAKVGQKILQRNNLPPREIDKIIMAGCWHDGAIPAGGDAVLHIDKENLDEETHWHQALDTTSRAVMVQRGIDQSEIDEIIRNGGILGEVLDIADRIAYVADDAYNLLSYAPKDTNDPLYLDEYYGGFYWQLRRSGNFANVYQDVVLDKKRDRVYFKNPKRLYNFLKLRAMLTHDLYIHPFNQVRDALISTLVRRFYTEDETQEELLTPNKLRGMTDNELWSFLDEKYDFSREFNQIQIHNFLGLRPRFEMFDHQDEAERFVAAIRCDSHVAFLAVRKIGGFKTGTNYLVKDQGGKILPFAQAEPEKTDELEEISRDARGYYVLTADLREDTPVNRTWRKALKPELKAGSAAAI